MKISQDEFHRIQILLEKFSGILLTENKDYLVVNRLDPLIKKYSLNSFSELLEQIETAGDETFLQQVIDLMTTNETLWFRDDYPFDFLVSSICSQWQSNEKIRILSVGCSTGQEPYSITMALDNIRKLDNTEIMAIDISESALQKAREGIYQRIEIERGLPSAKLKTYFSPLEDKRWQINQNLKEKVICRHINLLDTPYDLGSFDIIFCRNVLIYFSDDTKSKVLKELVAHLNPQGYLFLGGSESLSQKDLGMKIVRCNPGFAYQKLA